VLSLAGLAAGLAIALRGGDGAGAADRKARAADSTIAPGGDPDTIGPGRSIGAIRLGMPEGDVKALYGDGQEQQWFSHGRNGRRLVCPGRDGALTATLYEGKVVQVATTSPYYTTANGIRVGAVVPDPRGFEQGVDAWRGFVYEGHASWCLRGEHGATQLIQRTISEHIGTIFVTDAAFLAYLPAHVDPNPYTGGYEFFCAPQPLQP
jgi:hypothetical protein